jgi:hypothetical protein
MSILAFKPEVWSAMLLVELRKTLIYAQPTIVNRDYEGEIAQRGDTVHISGIGNPTVTDYTNGSVLTYEDVSDAGTTLHIDQGKSWAQKLDDIDRAQALGDPMVQVMQNSAYVLADKADQFVASMWTGVAAANQIGSTGSTVNTYTTVTDAYDKVLVPLRTRLTKSNVPTQGRYCVVSPEFMGSLLLDPRFIRANESGTTEGLRNGMVGRAAGFDILESNNTPNPTSDYQAIIAGYPGAMSYAEQIVETEALRLQTTFADAVRGLHVYGGKLVRPTGLAVAVIDPAA